MRLILMRHAKSDWSSMDQPDKARTLNARGQKSARAMGDWLRAHGYVPDLVLCSSAARTRQTLDLLALSSKVEFADALYLADQEEMLNCLSDATGQCVLMVGHNPGIAEFAIDLARETPDHPQFYNYPTCATTVFDIEADNWAELKQGCGTVLDFTVPRDVLDQQTKQSPTV